jgi:hypothetical protein
LCVVISYDAARKLFPEVGVIEMMYASLTDEVAIAICNKNTKHQI